jgi:RNA polymerase sigma factor (sigma-70 family)
MANSPTTRPSLLGRLGDARDHAAWSEFVAIYAPLVYGFVRKQGLQDADAADLTQDVLRAVSGAIGRLEYDPARGSFRGWLFTIVRNKLRNFLSRQPWEGQGQGGTSAQMLLEAQASGEEEQAAAWEREYEERLFRWAADKVRDGFEDATWQAFWLTAVEGQNAKAVSARLGMSVGAVYIAKSRVLARLREQVRALQGE